MGKQFFSSIHADLVGFYASMACAVHCAFLPLLLTVSAFGGLEWLHEPWLEITFIVSSIVIATFALGRNFRKHKHIRTALQIVAVGFTLILLSRVIPGEAHHVVSAAGGVTIALGHVVNWRQAKKSPCCETH